MSQVIARRYRPQGFDEVIGQEPIVRTLKNAIDTGRVAHGFIFSGHRGIGKTTVARVLAKALNCQRGEGPTSSPCGECVSCREIKEGNAVDVIEIDAASNRGIDEIRALRERVRYRPARDRYKFFILDEAHQLTDDAFNALLKTLEEPPEWAVFVLATTEPEALPATIRSRCQHYAFRAVAYTPILEHLRGICRQEGIAADDEALGLIAEAGEGSVRDALSLLDQAISHGGTAVGDGEAKQLDPESVRSLLGRVSSAHIRDLLQAVAADSSRQVLELADHLLGGGVGPAQLCHQLTQAVRNALVAQSAGADSELLELTESERAAAVTCGGWFREEELARFLQILLRTAGDLRHGQQQRLHFELGLIKMLHARRLSGVEDVIAALGGTAAPARAVAPAAPVAAAPPATPPRRAAMAPVTPPEPEPAIPAKLGLTEVKPRTVTPAAPAPPASFGGEGGETAIVLRHLEEQRQSALVTILARAEWVWEGTSHLELIFSGAAASSGKLAEQAATRKALATAIQTALQRSPEIVITCRPEAGNSPGQSATAAAALPGSPEERAQNHPLLQKIREEIPGHILRTRPIAPS